MQAKTLRTLTVAGALTALAVTATGQYTTLSKSTAGVIADADSGDHEMSGDGRYVAFATKASTLVAGDANGKYDVYVRDTTLGTTERISMGLSGAEPDSDSRWPAISDDGRYVAFLSNATNLVAGDTNGKDDAFLFDRTLGTTERVSLTYLGLQSVGGISWNRHQIDVSDDGRYVVFTSLADDMVSEFTGGATRDVFLRDVSIGTTTLVSIPPTDTASHGGWDPSIDADGSHISFTSNSWLIHSLDGESADDIFVWDLATESIELISIDTSGADSANGPATESKITPDGRYVIFESTATDLDTADTFVDRDAFLRDRTLGTTEVVSLNSAGAAGPYSDAFRPDVSADGRYVVFGSNKAMTGVVHPLGSIAQQPYLRDRTLGTTEYLSVPRPWWSSFINGGSGFHVSDDGATVLFQDAATFEEAPTSIHRPLVQLERNGSSNRMSMTTYNSAYPGYKLPLKGYDAPASGLCLVFFSGSASGLTLFGHEFDLGYPAFLFTSGVADAAGTVSITAPAIPASAAGLTFYLEMVSYGAGGWTDSNYIQVDV